MRFNFSVVDLKIPGFRGVFFYQGIDGYEWVIDAFKIIFSWAILMPIAVIISGKILSQPLKLPVTTQQKFTVPIPRILHLQANDGEVILGFAGFFITLLVIALVGGTSAYTIFKTDFGIDPGHFNSICILSSFITVIWSMLL